MDRIINDSSKTEIVLPDNNKITYTNENSKLTKTDANGLKTIYEYEQYGSLTDSNIQVLIKKVTYHTGLISFYTYEKAKKGASVSL